MLTSLQALLRLAVLQRLGVFICALATLLSAAGSASALEPAQTKTRVWGFDFAVDNSSGLFRAASGGKHQRNRLAEAEQASGSLLAARGAANFTRPLRAADFGANATVKALEGTLSVQDKVATVGIKYVEGNLGNPITALNALKETARQAGATTLRIEGTIANPRLEPVLTRILGPATRGAPGGPQDIWVLGL